MITKKKPITTAKSARLGKLNSELVFRLGTACLANASLINGSVDRNVSRARKATRLFWLAKGMKRVGRMPLSARLST